MFEGSSSTTTGMLVTAGLVVTLAWIINGIFVRRKNRSFGKPVPGSMGWPVIGHMPYLNPANVYPNIEYYTKKYGPIFNIKIGSYNAIVINDYSLIKKAFSSHDFTSRPNFLSGQLLSIEGHGLLLSSGNIWHEQRRFALRLLRDLGMGKTSLEAHVQTEIAALLDVWKNSAGKPIDVNVSLNIAITNIIWAIAAGERMEYDDPKFIKLVGEVNKKIELGSKLSPTTFVPWMTTYLPSFLFNTKYLQECIVSFNDYAQELIDGHKKAIDYDDPKDFVDHFLVEQKKEENNPETTFTNNQLLATIADLFTAGGETTATTLRWAILLISQDSVVQKKLQEEIDQMIGHDRCPNIDDYDKMPYTVAVVNEVLRFADLLSLSIFHSSHRDSTFEGFHIPKDSMVIGALGCAHRSPKYWKKPYEFYPEHFLDADGKLRQNVEGYFPFSTGKRTCAGERLARTELFDFIASFFQHFNMRLADSPKPNLEGDPRSGVIRWPNPYKVIMEERRHR